ncbi:MAG TPA: VOC family protein [Ohtaekwangia sp.]|nr:VOC family protein [Ohtaekwangia sp.]
MRNLISIIEIPTHDLSRAITFYQVILDVHIQQVDMGEMQIGVFPSNEETVNVTLINGNEYKPSADGTLVYFNAGHDLQIILDKVKSNGGHIIIPKTEISPEMGFFALFRDTEGNKLGLHAMN